MADPLLCYPLPANCTPSPPTVPPPPTPPGSCEGCSGGGAAAEYTFTLSGFTGGAAVLNGTYNVIKQVGSPSCLWLFGDYEDEFAELTIAPEAGAEGTFVKVVVTKYDGETPYTSHYQTNLELGADPFDCCDTLVVDKAATPADEGPATIDVEPVGDCPDDGEPGGDTGCCEEELEGDPDLEVVVAGGPYAGTYNFSYAASLAGAPGTAGWEADSLPSGITKWFILCDEGGWGMNVTRAGSSQSGPPTEVDCDPFTLTFPGFTNLFFSTAITVTIA